MSELANSARSTPIPPPLPSPRSLRPEDAQPKLPRETKVPPILRSARDQRLAPPAPPRSYTGYTIGWAALGLVATGYTALLMLGGLPRPAAEAISDTNNVVLDRTVADVAQLKRQMGALETEVAGVKSKAAQVDAREKQLAERVSTVEGRLEGFSSQLMQVAGDTNRKSGGTANAGVAPPASPAAQPPVAPTRVVNAPPPASPARAQPSRLETAGIQVPPADTAAPRTQARQAPPAAAPATVWSPSTEPVTPQPAAAPAVGQVTTQPSGVVLATGPSVDALRLSWSLLNERHRSALQPLEPRVVIIEPGRYQLVAGPLPNESEATRVCTTLRGRGVACQPSDFRGDRL